MRRRIEQLLNGIFEYEPEKLVLIPQELKLQGKPQEILHGSFHVEREDRKKVKGFLYSSNPRVKCSPVEFQGTVNEIQYQADLTGCRAGMKEEGTITVCSEQGEYTLPFTICVTEEEKETSGFPINDLEQLAVLAQEDFQLAYRYFLSEQFRELLSRAYPSLMDLYDGLGVMSFSYQSLEEFLCASGAKEPVEISLSQPSLVCQNLTETIRETVVLLKKTWGFQKIEVTSDSGFLRPEKTVITTDEFAGSTFDLNFILDVQQMHAGNNYARLIFKTPSQRLEFQVTARKTEDRSKARENQLRRYQTLKLEKLYVDYRLGKIDLKAWTEHSVELLRQYKEAGGQDPYADLFLVQFYFAQGNRPGAYELLETFDSRSRELGHADRYGFYLYLTTFFYQEASYRDRVEDEVKKLFGRDKTNWKLAWILLYLKKEYRQDEDQRYEAVREQFRMGCRSRILYLEAYEILKKNPFRMQRLGSFELALLRFGAKEQVLSVELIRQCANLALHHQAYSRELYQVLEEGYRCYPSAELVKAICYLLMKGGKKDSRYFPWYEKGVEAGLRVTGLYEYYMETMQESDIRKVPQIIRMYFAYDTALDYRKRAAIYRNMVQLQEQEPQLWQQYRDAMEKFTLEQLECERISPDLAILYQKFLQESKLTRSSAGRLARLLFTYEVTCDLPEYTKVIVHSHRMKTEYVQAFVNGHALVRIYDPDSTVLLENAQGERYAAEGRSRSCRLFESEKMLFWCAKKIPEYPGIVLHLCTRCMNVGVVNEKALPFFLTACEMEELTDLFRDELRKAVLHYYLEHPLDPSLFDFLEKISILSYVKLDKKALISLLAGEGLCQRAFAILNVYGAEEIDTLLLVRICSRMVLELEFEENEMLVFLCHTCFENGKYDDRILRYLLLYYEGPVQKMKRVWQAAGMFELDTMLLEEKMLMLLLFTRSNTLGSEPVFEAYWKKLGRKRLCRAYTNLKAYEYFVKGVPVAECVFCYIEKEYLQLSKKNRLAEQEEVARLALLQHYAQTGVKDEAHRAIVAALLREFGAKGMKFAFWKRFDEALLASYQMEGKVFAEYVGNPEHEVVIYYRMRGSQDAYVKEIVKNYFCGVFVKEFTLFDGEELECYLEEKNGDQIERTDLRFLKPDPCKSEDTTKFGLMNRISAAAFRGDEKTVWELIQNWKMTEYLTEEVFSLIETAE